VTCTLAAAIACGSDATTVAATENTADVEPTEGAPADGAPTTPAVLLAERVDSPDTRTIYVHLLPSVPTAPADRTRAYEFGSVYIFVYEGKVYIRDREAGTVTRYQVTDELELVIDKRPDGADAKLSTQPVGLRPEGMPLIFISPTRAYFLDTPEKRVIVWNPTTMEITSTVEMPDPDKAGFETGQIRNPVRVGDRVFAGVLAWEDYDNLRVHPGAGVMIFSATTDAPPTLIEDSRITGADNLFADATGDVYVLGNQGRGIYNVLGPGAGAIPPAGVLRIKNGATAFDPDYFVNLSAVTGSQAIVALNVLNDATLVGQLWDPGVDPRTQVTTADDFLEAEEFVYGLVDLTTQTFSRPPSIPRGGVGKVTHPVIDGVMYVQVYKQVSENVRDVDVIAVTPTGAQNAFTIPGGDLESLARVR
jgi:hypothetical protein